MKKIHVILFILSDETETFWHLVCFFDRIGGNNNYGEGATDCKTMSLGL